VARLLSRLILVLALTGLSAHHAPAVHAGPELQTVAMVGGQPDDITADARGALIWSNLPRGTVERLSGGRITTLTRGLSGPEGIVALPGGAIVVAEQGRDRVVRIERSGEKTALYTLQPVPGQEGVDGIGRDPRTGALLIPDSPRGTVLRLSPDGRRVRVIVRGLGRPVDAASDARGTILVPDGHLVPLVVITPRGPMAYRGALSTPDDFAIDRPGRVWITTLGDNGLWTIAPGMTVPRRVLLGLANPQGLTLDRCGDPIVVEQNTARIVRLLFTPRAARCPL